MHRLPTLPPNADQILRRPDLDRLAPMEARTSSQLLWEDPVEGRVVLRDPADGIDPYLSEDARLRAGMYAMGCWLQMASTESDRDAMKAACAEFLAWQEWAEQGLVTC